MKTRSILAALTPFLLAIPAWATSAGGALSAVLEPYEAVRQALVADDLAAVEAPALELDEAVGQLAQHVTADTLGVPAEELDEIRDMLPQLAEAAAALAVAGDFAAARDAFYDLSTALVRWRQAAGEGPQVVYCSMQERSWLQPDDADIGNPYFGQKMARCGEVVSK